MMYTNKILKSIGAGALFGSLFLIASAASAQTAVSLSDGSGQPGSVVTLTFEFTGDGSLEGLQAEATISNPAAISAVDMTGVCDGAGAVVDSCIFDGGENRLKFAVANGPGSPLPNWTGTIDFTIDAGAAAPQTIDIEWDTADPSFTPASSTDGSIAVTAATAVLNVQPDNLGFGDQQTGTTSAAQFVTVSNDGSDGVDLQISAINFSGEFGASGGTCTVGTVLADSASCSIGVAFSPITDGPKAGQVQVSSDAGSTTNDTVALTGTGVPSDANLTIAPPTHDFGSLDINDPAATQDFTLTNTGDDSLTIGTVSTAAPFSVSSNCNGATLSQLGTPSCTVTASFDPSSAGSFSESLSATSDANNVSASLEGDGTSSPDLSINPPFGPVDLGSAAPGDQLSANGSVTNDGSADGSFSCSLGGPDASVFSTSPSPLSGSVSAGGSVPFSLFCDIPDGANNGDEFEATLSCSGDGNFSGTHQLSCSAFELPAVPVPTMQPWALILFGLLMLLVAGFSLRYFRAN